MSSVVGHLCDRLGQNRNIYSTVWEYGFVSTGRSNQHAATLHTDYKHEPRRRLRGSTLQFGFSFLSEPLSCWHQVDLCLLNPCWSTRLKLASDRELMNYEIRKNFPSETWYHIQIPLFICLDGIGPSLHSNLLRSDVSNLDWTDPFQIWFQSWRLHQELWIMSQLQSNSDCSHFNERKHFSSTNTDTLTVVHIQKQPDKHPSTLRHAQLNWNVSPAGNKDRISSIFCLNSRWRWRRGGGGRGWCTTGRLTAGGAGGEPVPGLQRRRKRRRWRTSAASGHPNQERRRAHRSLRSFHLRDKEETLRV